mmetsp:Transcript_152153/g.269860  ORF Transcript_152153/g.269860 Transcript_152153/m.269860 type:complete len:368 (+) Transcript_152153:696-1799(+)
MPMMQHRWAELPIPVDLEVHAASPAQKAAYPQSLQLLSALPRRQPPKLHPPLAETDSHARSRRPPVATPLLAATFQLPACVATSIRETWPQVQRRWQCLYCPALACQRAWAQLWLRLGPPHRPVASHPHNERRLHWQPERVLPFQHRIAFVQRFVPLPASVPQAGPHEVFEPYAYHPANRHLKPTRHQFPPGNLVEYVAVGPRLSWLPWQRQHRSCAQQGQKQRHARCLCHPMSLSLMIMGLTVLPAAGCANYSAALAAAVPTAILLTLQTLQTPTSRQTPEWPMHDLRHTVEWAPRNAAWRCGLPGWNSAARCGLPGWSLAALRMTTASVEEQHARDRLPAHPAGPRLWLCRPCRLSQRPAASPVD